jgi:ABC-type antimicrobial peptide transport system permease subunit
LSRRERHWPRRDRSQAAIRRRSLLAISALELLVLTVAALLAVARLLASQREGESALLTARGATKWQLTRLTAAEVIPLSLIAALIGGIGGIWLARLLGSTLYGHGTAVLAALGVSQRSAAAQLFLEKLLLSVPAAALGLLLGAVVARLLVPAVTLSPTAQIPVPPPLTMFDLPQTIPLAAMIAVLPALAAALVVFRRPDQAAELRAAEAP